MLFFYSLGIFLPLFLLSVFYDRWQPSSLQKEIHIADRRMQLTTFLSGSLFVLMGLFLVIMGDTTYFNSIDPLSTKMLFYDVQNWLLQVPWANAVAMVILLASLVFLYLNRKTILQKEQN